MRIAFALTLLSAVAHAAGPIPRIEHANGRHTLVVDGKPFLILGAQVHNSSGWPDQLEKAWPRIEAMGANTLEVPVYWEDVEPESGRFNFRSVDYIVQNARRRNLRVVLLWFASWKNGFLDYAPDWVKQDPTRFPRALDATGKPMRTFSPHAAATRDADANAFAALMSHLASIDREQRTVIMVQVENEPGLRQVPGETGSATYRDHGTVADRLFAQNVPAHLVEALKKNPGSWQALFGEDAEEFFTAYHVASYINAVVRAGKKAYPLPMYVNAWLREHRFMRPGEDYPSGGPTSNVIQIWKAAAPDIDLLAPDIYHASRDVYREICSRYARPDNPLLVPENGPSVAFARNLFYALGDFGAIGFAPFGVDEPDPMPEGFAAIAANFRLLGPAVEQLAGWQRDGRVTAVVAESGVDSRLYSFRKYEAQALFQFERTGRALVVEIGPDEFIALGFGVRFQFRPRRGLAAQRCQFLSLEQGGFERGEWKTARRLNGDEGEPGLTLPPEGAIIRAKLLSY